MMKSESESAVNMVKHCSNGASMPALAAAQTLQMKMLNSRFKKIEDDKTYRLNKHLLKMEIEILTKSVLSEMFA